MNKKSYLSDWMSMIKVRKRTEMRQKILFRDDRHVLQAPLHNLRKTKGSEIWLKAKPQNGQLAFGSNNPFCGLTSASSPLIFLADYFEVAFLTYRSSLLSLPTPHLRPFSASSNSADTPTKLKIKETGWNGYVFDEPFGTGGEGMLPVTVQEY